MFCEKCREVTSRCLTYRYSSFRHSALDSHLWLFDYEEIKDILISAKHHGEIRHYDHLVGLLAKSVRDIYLNKRPFIATYVPSLAGHIVDRGFDHAQILCRKLVAYMPCATTELLVPLHIYSQTNLPRDERVKNPRYMCARRLKNELVLLIDDTATTRSTLQSAAYALKKAGAGEVVGVTLAFRMHMKEKSIDTLRTQRKNVDLAMHLDKSC